MPCKIKVTTYMRPDFDSAQPFWVLESSKHIDHDNSSDRKWLGNHCFWALRNNRRVVTEPIQD